MLRKILKGFLPLVLSLFGSVLVFLIVLFFLSLFFISPVFVRDENHALGKIQFAFDGTGYQAGTYFPQADISIKYTSAEELLEKNAFPEIHNTETAENYIEAARIGARILNEVYDRWTETGVAVVEINPYADAWIVSGQLFSRNSTFDDHRIGAVVFSRKTGEIFFIGKGTPVS